MLGAIFAFLIFNWEPSEVFMGDTGALVIGMTLAIMAIHFMETNFKLPLDSMYRFSASIGTVVCIVVIPLVDTLRIVIIRLSKRQSPFKPDKSHIHHALMRLGLTHGQTTMFLGGIQASYIGLAVLFNNYSERYVLSGVIVLSFLLSFMLDKFILGKLSVKENAELEKE
jgi:UDP-N-acetylmuramyl pentapeptide phosphotransferase/UDP-N-acetylglucosamine-1-phosphate transferase